MARSNEPAGAPGVIWIVLDDRMVQKCELVCFSPKVSDMSGGVLRRKLRQPVARIFFQHPSLRGGKKKLDDAAHFGFPLRGKGAKESHM